jgi:S-adenosylmethionine-diacylglycerol 3-amino-3-carboxypropyl transferase
MVEEMKPLRSKVAAAKFFSTLGYSTCWEDPEVLRLALRVSRDDTVLSVTSGGDLTIGLLLEDPKEVISIDLNPIQNYLLELKLACFRALAHPEMLAFLGVRPCDRRLRLYERLGPHLSREARDYWSTHTHMLAAGVLRQGRQDRYFFRFGVLLRLLLGPGRVESLLSVRRRGVQREFFDKQLNCHRWRWLFDLFFSRTVMSLSMDAAHFRLVRDVKFGPLLRRQADRILREAPAWENFFLHWVLTRSYPAEACMPPYLQEANFETICGRLHRITIVTEELETFLSREPAGRFSRFNLSNVFDWMEESAFLALIQEIVRVARPGARLCYYNLLNRRVVPRTMGALTRYPELAADLLRRNRAMGYTNFELCEVNGSRQKAGGTTDGKPSHRP